MKKFVFTLEALLQVKNTQKDKIQGEFAQAQARLAEARQAKAELEEKYLREYAAYEDRVKKGITAADLKAQGEYFAELRKAISAAALRVRRAQEEVDARQAALLGICKEIKVLEKLKKKQYMEYLAELAKADEATREDLLAFRVSGASAS